MIVLDRQAREVAPSTMAVTVAPRRARREKAVGLACLLVTAIGWGLNWPATKAVLDQCPPLAARGASGLVACILLVCIARFRGESLYLPVASWPRLVRAALLNVSAWMGLTTLSLLWLSAGEAATLAYTMPLWTAAFAWPVLGERLTLRRGVALVLGLSGVAVLVGGQKVNIARGDLPGVAVALGAAISFALGTVLSKRAPLPLAPIPLTAWQVGIGCLPLLGASLMFEHVQVRMIPWYGWAALAYTAIASLGICYLAWFAALRRLDAGTAAIGTLLTPIIGVTASAVALGEPLVVAQLVSLSLIVGGIIVTSR
jgi:drug/metabolite transporter (DMT)-like permease